MAIRILNNMVRSSSVYPIQERPLGFESKLPWLSKALHISPDPKDYFMFPVPIMYSDLPNRNGYAFPLKELLDWNTDLKCQAYEGWRYAPMYEEHRSEDITKALGVVADVALTPVRGYGNGKIWKLMALAAIDRTKNRSLAAEVEAGKINTYSMGALVESFTCSYCGSDSCSHIDWNPGSVTFYELHGKLVYKECVGVAGVELSVVRDPAFLTAISDTKLAYT